MFAAMLLRLVVLGGVAAQLSGADGSMPSGRDMRALKTLVCELLRFHPAYRTVGLNQDSECQFYVVPFHNRELCVWVPQK